MALFNLNGFVNVVIGNAMRQLNTVQNQTARTAAGMQNSLGQASTAANQMGKAFIAMGALFTAKLGGEALKKLIDFDDKMRSVNTLAKLGQVDFEKFSDTIANFGAQNKLATTATENAAALYEIYSANVLHGANAVENMAKAQDILKEASMAATGGLTDTKTAVDIMTTVMNTYGKEAGSIEHINDVLFKTVELGKVSYGELARSMSFVLGQATASKIPFEELSAIIATLTDKGQSSSIAARELRTMIGALTNPTKAAKEAMNQYGFWVDQNTLANDGLAETIKKVVTATGANQQAMKAVFRENTAVSAATLLATENFKLLNETLVQYGANLDGTGHAAFEEKMKSLANQWKSLKVQVEAMVLTYGAKLVPTITSVLDHLNKMTQSMNEAGPATKELVLSTGKWAVALVGLLGALSAVQFVVGALGPALRLLLSPLSGVGSAFGVLLVNLRSLAVFGPGAAQLAGMYGKQFAVAAASSLVLSAGIAAVVASIGVLIATQVEHANTAAVEEEMMKKQKKALEGLKGAYDDTKLSAKDFFEKHGEASWRVLGADILAVTQKLEDANKALREFNDTHAGQVLNPENAQTKFNLENEVKLNQKKLDILRRLKTEGAATATAASAAVATGDRSSPYVDQEAKAKNEAALNRAEKARQMDILRNDPNPGSQALVKAYDSEELERARDKANLDWVEFNRKREAGAFKSAKDEAEVFNRVYKEMYDAALGTYKDNETGKLMYKTKAFYDAELHAKALKIKVDKETEAELKKTNQERFDNELSKIAELSRSKKISFEQEIMLLNKLAQKKELMNVGDKEANKRRVAERIATVKGKIVSRDEEDKNAATAKAVATLQHQAKMYEYQARAMDHMIAGMIKQGKTADEINAKLKERLALTMKQIDAEEKAGIRGAKSEEEKAAIKAEADAKRTDATQVYQNRVEEVARKEVDQLNKSDDANRAVNDQKLQALQNQSGWLDRQEKQGKNVSGQRIAILKKENEIIINNIKSETANKLRDRQSEGALSSELAAIEAEGKQKVENILEQQKQTIYDILNAEKERTKNADPRQTLEEAMGDINAQMNSGNGGTSQGVYGSSNLGGPSAFGGPSLFSSSLNDMTGGFIGANPRGPRLNSAPAGVGDRWMQMAKAGSLGGAVKNFSNGGAGYSGDIRQKVAIEIDVNGKLSTVSGKLSTATLNGLFSDATGNARMRGSDGTRNGRQA